MADRNTAPDRSAQLQEANLGISALLDDDAERAQSILSGQGDSPFHLFGLGLVAFLNGALAMDEASLAHALECLTSAEHAASKIKHHSHHPPNGAKRARWWTPAQEIDCLIADSVAAQAMCHILAESLLEFTRAVVKLNRSYKLYAAAAKAVLPEIRDDDTVDSIIERLNAMAIEAALKPPTQHSEPAPSRWGISRLFGAAETPRSQTLDSSASVKSLSIATPVPKKRGAHSLLTTSTAAASAPVTPNRSHSPEPLPTVAAGVATPATSTSTSAEPSWRGDHLAELAIGGSAFGYGLFELVFALLPPKLRKVTSFFGYTSGSRSTGLKLMAVAAAGTDLHADFAAIVLLSYLGLVLQCSSWQHDRAAIMGQAQSVLGQAKERLPNGSLWTFHEAKLTRLCGDPTGAIAMLEKAVRTEGSGFKQAQALIRFELAFAHMSVLQWSEAAASFKLMRNINSWSHATYAMLELGALLMAPRTPATKKELDELLSTTLPSTVGKKRIMGQQPSAELFVSHHLDFYAAKRRRRPKARAHEVIAISPVLELAFQWQIYNAAPQSTCQTLIAQLEALTPAVGQPLPKHGSPTAHLDLDTQEELALRLLLLGVLSRRLGDFKQAKQHLDAALVKAAHSPVSPLDHAFTYLAPVARFERAALICDEAERQGDPSEWPAALDAAEAVRRFY